MQSLKTVKITEKELVKLENKEISGENCRLYKKQKCSVLKLACHGRPAWVDCYLKTANKEAVGR